MACNLHCGALACILPCVGMVVIAWPWREIHLGGFVVIDCVTLIIVMVAICLVQLPVRVSQEKLVATGD